MKNISDENKISDEYFMLKIEERNKLRTNFLNLSKYNRNFESVISVIEKDFQTRYKVEALPKF